MLKQIDKIILGVVFSLVISMVTHAFAILSCSITTSAGCTTTKVVRMSGTTNAHAEMPTQNNANYSNTVICCAGLSGTSCTGYTANVLKLSSTTNAHVEIGTNSNYVNTACISAGSEIPVIAYQDGNCTGYDTTLASISSTTNATIGDSSAYTKKVCGSLVAPSITFVISTTTLYFGGISPLVTRYASSTDTSGSGSEVVAHTLAVKTNTLNGYSVNIQGGTLSYGTRYISAIGSINTAPAIGTAQFGLIEKLRVNAHRVTQSLFRTLRLSFLCETVMLD